VLPPGLSVKKAAEMLRVGRPALSNLLNGNASLSPEMALRLEKAFGAKSEFLLQMQAAYDDSETRERAKEIAVRTYTPSLMGITARQIEAWADHHQTRDLLAVLLRRLVQSTGTNLTKVDFPAFDNAQRHGWDGEIDTDTATPWIPFGVSGWEFGCNHNSRQKAEDDYRTRVASVPAGVRKRTAFVFVTPRNWLGKEAWAAGKRAESKWKDVRALDASDLEQWIEESVPVQSWLGEQLGVSSNGLLSLEECWRQWAEVTKPVLSKQLFRGAIKAAKAKLEPWVTQNPTRPFVITADSEDEALAFTACALESLGSSLGQVCDRAVVIRSVDALRKVHKVSTKFIAIIVSAEAEEASAGMYKDQHTLIIRRRNSPDSHPDFALGLLDDETFRAALQDMGIAYQDIPRCARESGQSPTILRRRLAQIPAIKFPPWAQDAERARQLIALTFAGVWRSDVEADQEILKVLTGYDSYGTIEKVVADLASMEQAPVWAIGRHRGVVSKIDALYAIHHLITRQDLDHFFFSAKWVLSESDPALELPEEQRWAASIYGKARNHSEALRDGICETLVLLAVHGNNLFQKRIGINVEAHVDELVRSLLVPLKSETWASQQSDLPRYAEAAPNQFLDILESDLASDRPEILTLLQPSGIGPFGSCPRSGLLWALEVLAWEPQRLLRVARILARLSAEKIDDNWVNKPENSLTSLFRCWMPQTAATVEQRSAALEKLARECPSVGWRLCVDPFHLHGSVGHYNYRPRWRSDAAGAGEPITRGEIHQFALKARDLILNRPDHNEHTLADLVERLPAFSEEDQTKIWALIERWQGSNPTDQQKAFLRERIRRFALTRRGRFLKLGDEAKDWARETYEKLLPKDVVARHAWLFAQHWVDESLDDLEDATFDYEKQQRKIEALRSKALREVWASVGYSGVVTLCESGDAGYTIGSHLADGILVARDAEEFLANLVAEPAGKLEFKINNCVAGFLGKLSDEARGEIIANVLARFSRDEPGGSEKTVRLLRFAPFNRTTWHQVDQLPVTLRTLYWQTVHPGWAYNDNDELAELIDRFIEHGRPRAAFSAIHFKWAKVDSARLLRVLRTLALTKSDEQVRLEAYDISECFKVLNARADVSRDDLGQLEFTYLDALSHSKYGIPNLERQLAHSPALFSQAVALTYKRTDDGEDPPEWRPAGDVSAIAGQTYTLLERLSLIPGTHEDGTIKTSELIAWIRGVQALCRTHAREEIGDNVVGHLLAKAPAGPDGIWPCEAVCQALEECGSKPMVDGIVTGIYNSRGVHFRSPGGDQERELASRYRGWSKELAFNFPFASKVLEQIALTYDHDAKWQDDETNVRRRIGR
jgi:addiction module HigA family antidote